MAPMHFSNTVYWDPITVLGIDIKTQTGVTCQGTNASGARCGNLVAMKDGRENAIPYVKALRSIPVDKVAEADLRPMAGWLMCKAWHRDNSQKANAKVDEWFTKIDRFIASGMPPRQDTATTERLLQESLLLSVKLREQLKESQRRLADQEYENKVLREERGMLKSANRILLAEKSAIARTNDQLEKQMSQRVETHQNQAKVDSTEIARLSNLIEAQDHELKEEQQRNAHLQAQLERNAGVIDAKNAEIDQLSQTLRNQEVDHGGQIVDLRDQLLEKDRTLRELEDLVQNMNTKYHKEKESAATEIQGLQEKHQQLKMKMYFQTLRSQVILFMKQRRYHEVKADNEALLEQHKTLQQAMSNLAVELQAAEVRSEKQSSPIFGQGGRRGKLIHFTEIYFAP